MFLDCENFNSTIKSLSSIMSIREDIIKEKLGSINIDKVFEENDFDFYPNTYLLNLFKSNFNIKTQFEFDGCYWFHNTRVSNNVKFTEGILPLNLVIKQITSFIDSIAGNKKLDQNKNVNIDWCGRFENKKNNKTNWGPFGFLVREISFIKNNGFHDYLKTPEIVEDYIGCFYSSIQDELIAEYSKRTRPCIIKFESLQNNEDLIGRSLYYLYRLIKGEKPNQNSNTCYNGKSNIIEPNRIKKIEYL